MRPEDTLPGIRVRAWLDVAVGALGVALMAFGLVSALRKGGQWEKH